MVVNQEKDQKHDNVWTYEAVPSTTKKMKYGCMKMLGHRNTATSILFLLESYQDWLDLDSNLTMTREIISIPRKMKVGGLSHWKTTL